MVDRGIALGEEAVRKNPNQVSSRLQLADLYGQSKRYQDAIIQYSEVLKAQKDNRLALLGRGKAYLVLGNIDPAFADFQALVAGASGGEMANVDPQLEEAYYNLGVIELKRNQPKDAVIQLSNALRIDRTDADALNLLGTALIQTGDFKTAVVALDKAVALVPTGWCDPYVSLGQAYAGLKDAVGIEYAAGMTAACQKDAVTAKAKLEPLTTGPMAVDALVGLGLLAEDQADVAAATSYYEQALKKDAQNFAAITGLNRLDTGGHGTSATSGDASPSASAGN
jgi:tetratricopeptide (TPR) repeat protein